MKEIRCGNYTIIGGSRSTQGTYIQIKELGIIFDLGYCPHQFTRIQKIFLSHCHIDHILGVYYHIAQRTLRKLPPSTIYLPAPEQDAFEEVIQKMERLERSQWQKKIIPVKEGEKVRLNDVFFIRAFKVEHRIPSYGYTVFEHRRKLKAEYKDLPKADLIKLKKQGEEVTSIHEIPILSYTGDSTANAFSIDSVRRSNILITECTFLTPEHYDLTIKNKHIHLEDILNANLQCEHLILMHFSLRYSKRQIATIIKQKEKDLPGRVHFLL
ncbi:MAG: MBL fold metallo-hydrolase [Promethearchaeota archaeon]